MGRHFDEDGDGLADQAVPRFIEGDYDLGVPHVDGQYFHRLEVFPGGGRHVLHDARSLRYDAAEMVRHVTRRRTTYHQRQAPIWDQGEVGASTAFAACARR